MDSHAPQKMMRLFTFIFIGLLSAIVYSTNVFAKDGYSPSIGLSKETSGDSETQFFFQLPDGRVVVTKPKAHHTAKQKEPVIFRSIATAMKVLLRKCFNGSAKMNLELVLESVIKHLLQVLKT